LAAGENAALAALNAECEELYAADGRPSIAPERLLRAALIQILFSIRSERQLMDQLQYNLLFRWLLVSVATMRCGFQPCSPKTTTGS